MTFHAMRITKAGRPPYEIVCQMGHKVEDGAEVQEFNSFKEALESGWKRENRRFVCPECAGKAAA